jgi:hypothetical protein
MLAPRREARKEDFELGLRVDVIHHLSRCSEFRPQQLNTAMEVWERELVWV